MGDVRHFIHYLPRRVVLRFPRQIGHPFFQDVAPLRTQQDFGAPRAHVLRQAGPLVDGIRPGDKVWIVSQLRAPWGALAPALDACLHVADRQTDATGLTRLQAGAGSEWFGLHPAQALLGELRILDAQGRSRPLLARPGLPVGQALQGLRRLDNPQRLEGFARRLRQAPLHFVSYRIEDGTRQAFAEVARLMDAGRVVFWDRWCLPRRLAERRAVLPDQALDDYLMECLDAAERVSCIASPGYGRPGSASARELARARATGKAIECLPQSGAGLQTK